jgi:hypothetical protein
MDGKAPVFAVLLIPIGRIAVRRFVIGIANIKVLLSSVRVEITKVVELMGRGTGAEATGLPRSGDGLPPDVGWLTILLP